MNTKIIIVALLAVGAIFGFGYYLSPHETIEMEQFNQTYLGTVEGQCDCYIGQELGDTPQYNGSIKGYFYGLVNVDGESRYANVTITEGEFRGEIYGRPEEGWVYGSIDGQGRFDMVGIVETKKMTGFAVPSWLQMFIFIVGGLLLLKFAFPEVVAMLLDKMGGGRYTYLDENEIEDDIIRAMRTDRHLNVNQVLDVIREPPVKPRKLHYLIELMNNENIIVPYERRRIGIPKRNVTESDIRLLYERAEKFKPEKTSEDKKFSTAEWLKIQRGAKEAD